MNRGDRTDIVVGFGLFFVGPILTIVVMENGWENWIGWRWISPLLASAIGFYWGWRFCSITKGRP